jgi:hypothetical protein
MEAMDKQRESQPSSGRRWFRFSLRSLMAVTTVVCIATAFIARSAKRQEAAVAVILRSGGTVAYAKEGIGARLAGVLPHRLVEAMGTHYFYHVEKVGFDLPPADSDHLWFMDDDMFVLANLPHLQDLSLSHTGVTDVGLAILKNCPHLKSLDLQNTAVNGPGFSVLRNLSDLHSLSIGGFYPKDPSSQPRRVTDAPNRPNKTWASRAPCTISEAGVRHLGESKSIHVLNMARLDLPKDTSALAGLTELLQLQLDHTSIADEQLGFLEGLNDLQRIDVSFSTISDRFLSHLAPLRSLETVSLKNIRIERDGITHLGKCPSLTRLGIENCEWPLSGRMPMPPSPESLAALKACGNLSELRLLTEGLTADHLAAVSQISTLELLEFGPGGWWAPYYIPDKTVMVLQKLPCLNSLDLRHMEISDEGLFSLAAIPNLRTLKLRSSRITPAGISQFVAMKPGPHSLEAIKVTPLPGYQSRRKPTTDLITP